MKKLRWLLETALFLSLSYPLALLPTMPADRLGRLLGRVAHRLMGRRRRIALDNVQQVMAHCPETQAWTEKGLTAEQIVGQVFANLGRSLMEVCRLYHGCGEALIQRVDIRGLEHYDTAKAKGKGVICITGHCGNWELMALSFGYLHGASSVVARKQDNPYLNRMLERVRGRYGNGIIYKKGALREMFVRFRRGETVGILIDQSVLPDEGVLIPFLGRTAWATTAPVALARKCGVPLVPFFMHREGERFVIEIEAEMALTPGDDDAAAQQDSLRLAKCLERYILNYPSEWYWIHNRWKRAGEPVGG